jgi:hypothetical protein
VPCLLRTSRPPVRGLEAADAAVVAAAERLASIPDDLAAVEVDTSARDALAADIRAKRDVIAKRAELAKLVDDLVKADAEREVYAAIEWACQQALAREGTGSRAGAAGTDARVPARRRAERRSVLRGDGE